ncbi:MAG: MarR family transcriptional regulator [Stappia sp.]|uniref:MarR family winged helix-turn-helix transcriptional regulator n=1 Tax=Stappia sp. TaxID=1870903 RepID=UPI000C47D731|nr:MarR family transcriptional regulator [Stappia sp.]MAA97507.1 MarR family transcriptional regulator [Stappia sp.]MBM22040.1 MarR family transcriptional regulator [Stappia sp.]
MDENRAGLTEETVVAGEHVLDAETRLSGSGDHRSELRLWLRLLTCTNLIEGEIRSQLRAAYDVTLPRFDLLAQLEKTPEGLTLGELSRRMMVSAGNVTGLVERLVQDGQVERRPVPGDRRSAVVLMTAQGRRSFEEMANAHGDWIGDIFAGLEPDDIEALMRLLAKTKASAMAAAMKPDAGNEGKGGRDRTNG